MCDSHKCTKNLFAYGSKKPIDVAGSFTAEISVGKTSIMAEFIVLAGHGQNLLGKETALCLNVLRLGPEHMNSVRKNDLLDQFSNVFSGLWKLKNPKWEVTNDKTLKSLRVFIWESTICRDARI